MNMFVAAAGGAAAGFGLWLTVQSLRRPRLDELLPPPEDHDPAFGAFGTIAHTKELGATVLRRWGWPGERARRDLAVCGKDIDTHRTEATTAAIAGLVLCACLVASGVPPASPMNPVAAVVLGLLALVIGLVTPGLHLRKQASQRREHLRTATSVIADLVGVALAGGAGVTGALTAATLRGSGPAFTQIRQCLHEANLRTRPPWDALADLAQRTGVRELDELASSIRLAGTDGARVRASVRAKATSLRAHRLAAMEARANEATEHMTLPVMLLVLGFLLLMGYPAIAHVLTGF
jgi:Flp pilus assembly protein TadB